MRIRARPGTKMLLKKSGFLHESRALWARKDFLGRENKLKRKKLSKGLQNTQCVLSSTTLIPQTKQNQPKAFSIVDSDQIRWLLKFGGASKG